jgi:Rrf2 family protein
MRIRLSMKTEYGARAIYELAAAYGGEALQSAEIARRQKIPGPFLDQVLMTLRRAGLVRSVRGPRGGHLLARSPSEIRLDEVIASLEGDGAEQVSSDRAPSILAEVTGQADRAAQSVFAAHTLADLLRSRSAEPPVFHGIFKPLGRRTARTAGRS